MKDNLYIILKVNFQTLGNNVIHNTQHNTYRDCEVKLKWLLMVTPPSQFYSHFIYFV